MNRVVGISSEAALDCSWRDGLPDGPLVEVAGGETVVVVPYCNIRIVLRDFFVLPESADYFDVLEIQSARMRLISSVVPAAVFALPPSERLNNPLSSYTHLPLSRLEVHVRNVSDASRKFRAYFKVVERSGY